MLLPQRHAGSASVPRDLFRTQKISRTYHHVIVVPLKARAVYSDRCHRVKTRVGSIHFLKILKFKFKFIDLKKTKFKFKFIDFKKTKFKFQFIDFAKVKFKFINNS